MGTVTELQLVADWGRPRVWTVSAAGTSRTQWQLLSEKHNCCVCGLYIHSKLSFWSVGHLIRRSCDRLIRCWVPITCELRANNSGLRRRGRSKQTVGAIGSVRRWCPTRAHPLWLSSTARVSRLNCFHFPHLVPMATGISLRRETLCFRVAMWDQWEGRLEPRMRKDEVTRGQSVATRIKQFETANNDNNNKEKNNNNNNYSGGKRTGGTPNGFGSASR